MITPMLAPPVVLVGLVLLGGGLRLAVALTLGVAVGGLAVVQVVRSVPLPVVVAMASALPAGMLLAGDMAGVVAVTAGSFAGSVAAIVEMSSGWTDAPRRRPAADQQVEGGPGGRPGS